MILLSEFIDMAANEFCTCRVRDRNTEKVVFKGKLYNIPRDLLNCEVTSWEISGGKMIFYAYV